jgi:hypothetical protein
LVYTCCCCITPKAKLNFTTFAKNHVIRTRVTRLVCRLLCRITNCADSVMRAEMHLAAFAKVQDVSTFTALYRFTFLCRVAVCAKFILAVFAKNHTVFAVTHLIAHDFCVRVNFVNLDFSDLSGLQSNHAEKRRYFCLVWWRN